MTTLAAMMEPIVDGVEPLGRAGLEQALLTFADVQTEIVGFEAASKSLPKIRKRAQQNMPSVLTKGGTERASNSSTLVISMSQLVGLIGRLVEAMHEEAVERRPADAVLDELVAIGGDGQSIAVGRGAHEETQDGHIRF
jgi:hypothetical protein